MKKVLLTDFFGVLSTEDSPLFFRRYVPEKEVSAWVDRYFHRGDRGEWTFDEIVQHLSEDMKLDAAFIRHELFSIPKPHQQYIDLLKEEKKQGKKIVLVSNASDTLPNVLMKRFGIADLFDYAYISYQHKVTKPDPKVFALVLDAIQEKGEDCLFVDDHEENLLPAKAFQIETVLYQDTSETLEVIRTKMNR